MPDQQSGQSEGPPKRGSSFLVGTLLLVGLLSLPYLLSPPPPKAPAHLADQPGVRLIYRHECGKCHQISALPEIQGKMGPRLDGLKERAGGRVAGLSSREYIRQSLIAPEKYTVEGYLKGMPSYASLPAADLDELLDYLEKL